MKRFFMSAMVVYSETIDAETEEEALDMFADSCPYDIESDIECDTVYEDREDEIFDEMIGRTAE